MSGIAGIVRLDGGSVEADDLNCMGASLMRDSDYTQVWHAGGVGLAHAALLTTPEAIHMRQPFTCNSQQWITADARLDNRDDLHHILDVADGPVETGASDAELIVRAYAWWGADCVAHLSGDFAFAVWDAPRQTLFCARDHFGVRNFHYYQDGTAFVFGSMVQAILSQPHIDRTINEGRIADTMVNILEVLDHTSTFYQHIYRLPKAHTLTLRNGTVSLRQYWTLELPPPIRFRRDEAYADAFLDHFRVAVRARLRSAAPAQVGSMLSGGSDSSSLVGVSRDTYRQWGHDPFRTFSAVADDDQPDDIETRYITAVVRQGGLDATRIRPSDLPAYLPDLAYLFDSAADLFDFRIGVPELMCVAARRRGVRVLMTGSGGDEFASLTPVYPMYLARQGRFVQAFRETWGMARFYGFPARQVIPDYMRYVYHALVPLHVRQLRWRGKPDPSYATALNHSIINPAFAERINLRARFQQAGAARDTAALRSIRAETAHFMRLPYLNTGLERYDRVATAYGVELRHPYLDKRLVEFMLALPPSQITRDGWQKYVVRRAMAGILTDEVRWRRGHQHLGETFQQARTRLEADRIHDLMTNDLDLVAPYMDVTKLKTHYAAFQTGQVIDPYPLWHALTLALWLKRQ